MGVVQTLTTQLLVKHSFSSHEARHKTKVHVKGKKRKAFAMGQHNVRLYTQKQPGLLSHKNKPMGAKLCCCGVVTVQMISTRSRCAFFTPLPLPVSDASVILPPNLERAVTG